MVYDLGMLCALRDAINCSIVAQVEPGFNSSVLSLPPFSSFLLSSKTSYDWSKCLYVVFKHRDVRDAISFTPFLRCRVVSNHAKTEWSERRHGFLSLCCLLHRLIEYDPATEALHQLPLTKEVLQVSDSLTDCRSSLE